MTADFVPASIGADSISDLLQQRSREAAGACALLGLGRRPLTYAELTAHLHRVAGQLGAVGVGANDRVAVVLPDGPDLATAFLAIASCATFAPLNPAYRAEEFEFYLADLQAKVLIVAAGKDSPARAVAAARRIPVLEAESGADAAAGAFDLHGDASAGSPPNAAVRWSGPDDIALVLHTSGTTSRPKMVPLTHWNLCSSGRHIAATLALGPQDRCLCVMPLFHIHGLIGALLSSLTAGGSVVCTPGFIASRFLEWLEEFRPTWYSAVPTMHQAILMQASSHVDTIRRRPLRFIRSSSAALPPQVMSDLEKTFAAPVIEAYGMTEAAHQMASNPLPPRVRKPGSVGVAAGPELAIVDEHGALRAPGETGEIAIRGPNVTRGYTNNPQATAAAFSNGWFRTGDQGYIDGDGYVFITGRLKELINRGGEKIAPREIDEALLAHPAVAQAVAFAVPDPRLGEEIGAAVVLRPGASVTEAEIQRFLLGKLADFKVPRRIAVVKEIPRGPTGKLQRIGLAAKLGLVMDTPPPTVPRPEYAAPRNGIEVRLADLWCQVLGVKSAGIHDRFLETGGDSIQAARLIGRVREAFGVELSVLAFFQSPTLAGIAEAIAAEQAREQGPGAIVQAIPRRPDRTRFPLSFAQERMWVLQQFEPQSPVGNRPACLRLRGALDVSALEYAINEVVKRHDVLRTTVEDADGQGRQCVAPYAPFRLPVRDLAPAPAQAREDRLQALADEHAQRPFDLARGPLFRAELLRVAAADHALLLTFHHAVFDGWSFELLCAELAALYGASHDGRPAGLPELPIQYGDFACWQREWLQNEVLARQLDYWRAKLAGASGVLDLPTDSPRPPVQHAVGACLTHWVAPELGLALKELSRREGVTLFVTLFAGFNVLLHRYTGQEDIVAGVPVAARTRPETEKLIGCLINTLALRTDLAGNPTVRDLLRRTQRETLDALAHQDLPFERLVAELNLPRDLSRSPLFQVLFQLRNLPHAAMEWPRLHVEPLCARTATSKFDIALDAQELPAGLLLDCEYNTELFQADTIKRMLGHLEVLLGGMAANPAARLSELPLLTDAERHQILVEWTDTAADYPRDACIHELFEEQAARTPDAVAVECGDQRLTYAELNGQADRVARCLSARRVAPDDLVGFCVERSLAMVAGLLGVLKAGGAYWPVDPDLPDRRLELLLADARPKLLLVHERHAGRLAALTAKAAAAAGAAPPPVVTIEAVLNDAPPGAIPAARRSRAEDLAYVMYTSGSTGRPKGVMVPHRAVVRLVRAANYASLTPRETLLHMAPLSFDASSFELWGALLNGSRVVLLPPGQPSLMDIGQAIRERGVSTLWLTAGLFHLMVDERVADLGPLRQLLTGGDVLSVEHVRKAFRALPACRLVNGYGPTENATFTCCHTVVSEDELVPSVPIGRPIANTQVYVLDARRQPVPVGVPGDLYAGGDGVARGYLNQPELTAERFIADPFSRVSGARLYRTGDRVRWRTDGQLEFLGRLDQQVKIRGFRVELEEVEAVLRDGPGVREAVVTVDGEGGGRRLVAGIVPAQGETCAPTALREHARRHLPEYMVPAAFVRLAEIPLTPSGKVDRCALARTVAFPGDVPVEAELPRTPIERTLAEIWSELLGTGPVGLRDNFFDRGGHSLLATVMVSRVRRTLGVELPLRAVFEATDLAALARIVERLAQTASVAPPPIRPAASRRSPGDC